MLNIPITNQQDHLPIDSARLRAAIETVFTGESITGGEVSLAVVDDPTIHDLNRRWLNHDEPTDVLSFVLEESDGYREGEIIVSADAALARAAEFAWPAETELLLYVVHGTLHLVGYDDQDDAARQIMRERERFYLERLGIKEGSAFVKECSGFRVQGSEDPQAETSFNRRANGPREA